MNARSLLIFILLGILFFLLPFTVYVTKSYWVLTAKFELIRKHKKELFHIGLDHNLTLTKKLNTLSHDFLNSRFILNGETDYFLVNVEKVCKHNTGVNCVFSYQGRMMHVTKKYK